MTRSLVLVACLIALPSAALAQRVPFERSFDAGAARVLDVETDNGRITVTAGEAGRIVVTGTVTIRQGWNVPADALAIAQAVAAKPPVTLDGQTVTLRMPADAAARRAVSVSYQVRVPRDTTIRSVSDSGATSISGVSQPVSIRTQSAAIGIQHLGGGATITTGSGAVTADGVAGALSITTSSSGVTAQSIGGSLRVRTESGAVVAALSGEGDADVETGSSAIRVTGSRGGIAAQSRSGRIILSGTPRRDWTANAESGSVECSIDHGAAFTLDASSDSGSVVVSGATVQGTVTKSMVAVTVGGGGPMVKLHSRSGSIAIRSGSRGR